jgi:hypothetical protein
MPLHLGEWEFITQPKNQPATTSTSAQNTAPALLQNEAAQMGQIQTLNERAEALKPHVEVVSEVEAGIVQYNLSQLMQMGVTTLQQQPNPNIPAPLQSLIPVNLKNLPAEESQKLRAMVEEETAQARDDLRAGRMSAVLDTQDYYALGREESLALMRVQQGLQEAGIPKNFNGKSPTSEAELRSLQTLGYVEEVASARSINQELQALYSEQQQLNQQRAEMGLPPVELPALTESLQRMETLDHQIAEAGKEVYELLGGFGSDYRPAFSEKPLIAEEQSQQRPSQGQNTVTIPINLTGILPGDAPLSLTQSQTDELIRVNDSLNLLQGNKSGLSLKDVPMSEDLRNALNIPPEVAPTTPFTPFNPFVSTQTAIDRIALLPAEERAQSVADAGKRIIGESVHQSAVTKALGEAANNSLMGHLTNAKNVSSGYGELATLNTEATTEVAALAAQAAIYGNHAQAMDMLRAAAGYTTDMRTDNSKLEQFELDLRFASAQLVSDLLIGTTELIGGAAIAKQLGKATANNVAKQTGRNIAQAELANLSQSSLERLAREEASSILRNQLSKVTKADMAQQTRSSLASLTQQQAKAQGEAFAEAAKKVLSGGTAAPRPNEDAIKAIAQNLNSEYSQSMQRALQEMQSVFPEEQFGTLLGRPKDPTSIADKLGTKIDAGKLPANLDYDAARSAIGDGIGTRLVLKDTSPQGIDQFTDTLADAIRTRQLNVTEINNYRGPNGTAYLSEPQISKLQQAAADAGTPMKVLSGNSAVKPSGYTTTQMNITHPGGISGEFQVRGSLINELAEQEHIFYDLAKGKDLSKGHPELREFIQPTKDAVESMSEAQQIMYREYLSQTYSHTRQLELGIPHPPPKLPEGISPLLEIENLSKTYHDYSSLKQQLK